MRELIGWNIKTGTSLNDSAITHLIRRYGPISRADIARLTGLTPPTVTNITNRLFELGLLTEYKIGKSSGGRRPLLLKLNPAISQVVIVNIRTIKIVCHLVDPEYHVLYEVSKSIVGLLPDEIIEKMLEMIEECRLNSTAPVQGIGVVLRGPVRSQEGISVFCPNIGWKNIPLKYIIEERFRVTALIENDARAFANGEFYYGAANGANNMVLLKVAHGIGSGIILGGRLYRGVNDSAGEFGHTTVDIDGPLCSCGNYGCLEALASEKALVDWVVREIEGGQPSCVMELAGGDLSKVGPEEIYQAANDGDELAIRGLRQVARYLGIGVANLVNIFNPELFVIGGGLASARHFIEDVLQETVRERSFESCSSILEIRFSTSITENTIKGLADMVFTQITEPLWLGQK